MKKILVGILTALLVLAPMLSMPVQAQNFPGASGSPFYASRPGGIFYAPAFNWQAKIVSGITATGTGTIVVAGVAGGAGGLGLPDGTTLPISLLTATPTSPLIVDWGQAAQETVTPTAVSVEPCPAGNIGVGGSTQCASITASFNNTHGASGIVQDASYGLQTAADYAQILGGGMVVIDPAWSQMGGTSAAITAAIVEPKVAIRDERSFAEQYWVPQGGATVLATPTTLTALTALPSTTPAGAFGTGTYHMCIAYVDIMGQEGNCSADFSQAGLSSGSFIFSAPAASTGAVGYTIYIGLTGGGVTNLDYKVPLTTQPSVIGAYPASNGVCTLTTLETTTPACAVANAAYSQAGATATVTAITVNTSQINPETTIISTTSVYVPNPGGRNAYTYVPGSHIGTPGMVASELAFPIGAATGTTVPTVIGTINVPPGFMNYAGRTLEVCGVAYGAGASTATIENIQFQWDAMGQNTAGAGVKIGDLNMTLTGTLHYTFCEDFQTTVASASATGGSIIHAGGWVTGSAASQGLSGAGADVLTAAVGSLNLAAEARINIIYLHVTGTDGAGVTLQGLTLKVIN